MLMRGSPMNQRLTSTGFTLIELLVVVSIIAILAAMLLPAIKLVRDQARGMVCMSQLRQVVMANMTYRTDNDGVYPQVYWDDPGWNTWSSWGYSKPTIGHWQQFLEEYTETFKVFNCPVSAQRYPKGAVLDQDSGGIQRGAAPGGGAPGWPTCQMAYNSQNFGRAGSWVPVPNTATTRALNPLGPMTDGKVAAMITARNNAHGTSALLNRCPVYFDGMWQNDGTNHQSTTTWSGSYWPHRNLTANMAFSDGHTETRPYSDMVSFATSTTVVQVRQ